MPWHKAACQGSAITLGNPKSSSSPHKRRSRYTRSMQMWKDQLKTKGPKDQLQPSKKRIRFTSFDLSWLTSIKWVVFFCFEGSQRSTTVLRASPPSFPQPLYTASGATREGGGKTHWNPQVSQKEEQHLGHDKFSCVHRGFKGVDLQRLESE